MNIDWTFRGDPLTENARDRIGQQLSKLGRFLRDPADARIVVAHEGPGHHRVDLEVVLTSPDGTFKGRGAGHDVIDVAKNVLQRVGVQVQKVHDKRLESRRRGVLVASAVADEEE